MIQIGLLNLGGGTAGGPLQQGPNLPDLNLLKEVPPLRSFAHDQRGLTAQSQAAHPQHLAAGRLLSLQSIRDFLSMGRQAGGRLAAADLQRLAPGHFGCGQLRQ